MTRTISIKKCCFNCDMLRSCTITCLVIKNNLPKCSEDFHCGNSCLGIGLTALRKGLNYKKS